MATLHNVNSSKFSCCLCLQDNGCNNDPTSYLEYTGTPAKAAVQGMLARRGVSEIQPSPAVPAHGSWVEKSRTNYMTSPMQLDICAQHHKMYRNEFEEYKHSALLCSNRGCIEKLYFLTSSHVDEKLEEQVAICRNGHRMTRDQYKTYVAGPRRCPVQHCLHDLILNPNSDKAWDRIVSMCSNGHMACDKC